jgi:hypothetical protein
MKSNGTSRIACFLSFVFLSTGLFVKAAQEARSPLLDSFEQYLKLKQSSEFGLEWIPLGRESPALKAASTEAATAARPGSA